MNRPSVILDEIVALHLLQVYQAVLESLASEHAARMVAMRNATDNAIELVEDLQLQYNKARQQTITNDLLDIAGGAEALAKAVQG
jgi:F-type H+-transporting ATPase subunit gamma